MRRYLGPWTAFMFMLLLAPGLSAQQNATVQGIVFDESQGVLPGATVTMTEISTGVQTVAVSAGDGRYRFDNLAPGQYKLRIELSGFATPEITGIELLVGQNATMPRVSMKVATVQETVTVTSQVPLVDTTSSQVAGNIDRRQMAELPLEGRNWQELSLMVKGITANSATNTPGVADDQFQLNLDGQQITQRVAASSFGEPKVSREAIAEFQIITNQFDITQGRSTGVQVQAISRSGTNKFAGSTYGFFRTTSLDAADPVTGTVLPYQDQQAGFTLGGPIVMDKMHFFFSYEYERTPSTAALAPTLLPDETWQFASKTLQGNYLGRVDYQWSAKNSLTVRGQHWDSNNPFAIGSGGSHPSMAENDQFYATNYVSTWTHVISSNLMMQAQGGINRFSWYDDAIPSNTVPFYNTPFEVPSFSFPGGLSLGGQANYPNDTWQNTYSGRLEVNKHSGKHEMKFGGEYLRVDDTKNWDLNRRGTYVFNKTPSTAILEADFPAAAWNNPAAWNISNLQPYLQEFDITFNPDYQVNTPRPTVAVWFGDNWRIANNFTVNLGIRYDADWGATNPPGVTPNVILINNGVQSGDFGYKTGIRDLNNVAPRIGFAYNVGGTSDFVIRGGSGLYYNTPVSNVTYSHQFYNRSIAAVFKPTGTNFLANPTAGVTAEQFLSGAVAAPVQSARIIDPAYKDPFGWQSSIGFQKQLGQLMGVEVDLTDLEERNQVRSTDPNLFYDPVTGYNKDPTIYGRPNPAWGQIEWLNSGGATQTRLLSSSFTRRFSHNFQASATYTRTLAKNDDTTGFGYFADNQFNPNADWGRSSDFQRDTLRANGIINLPLGVTLSTSYFYGSGTYYNGTTSSKPFSKPGTNRLNIGAPIVIPTAMLSRWDGPAVIATGTTWPRNALEGLPLHKIDMRVSKRIKTIRNVNAELSGELFNVFNWKNYGSYNTTLTSPSFGQPIASSGNAYIPREGQLGVRVSF